MIRIVLVDGHRLFRVSLKSLINSFPRCEVVLDVDSLRNIPKDYNSEGVNLVIFDPFAPQSVQTDLLEDVQDFFPESRMLILSDNSNREEILSHMEKGVSGYFSKEDCPSQLERSILDVSQSYSFEEVRLGAVVRQSLIDDVGYNSKRNVEFTERELQILRLVCMEKTNIEISDTLGLSVRTIESHRRRMIEKADCRSIIGVILNALDLKTLNQYLKATTSYRASG